MNDRSHAQSGSAFWIILIAIMLFAGLTYAVSRGGAGSATALTNDQARAAAAEIIAYGDTLAKTVQTLKLRGCADNQFDFQNTVWVTNGGSIIYGPSSNPTAASGCGVFSASEGKMSAQLVAPNYAQIPNPLLAASPVPGSARISETGVPGIGSATKEDLVYRLVYLRKDVCMAINAASGVNNPGNFPPTTSAGFWSIGYDGVFADTNFVDDPSGSFTGKSSFCICHNTSNPPDCSYARVLLTR